MRQLVSHFTDEKKWENLVQRSNLTKATERGRKTCVPEMMLAVTEIKYLLGKTPFLQL